MRAAPRSRIIGTSQPTQPTRVKKSGTAVGWDGLCRFIAYPNGWLLDDTRIMQIWMITILTPKWLVTGITGMVYGIGFPHSERQGLAGS